MNTEAKQWRGEYQFDPFSPWWSELRQKIRQNEVVTKVQQIFIGTCNLDL